MTDVEREVRELLQRKADDAWSPPGAPPHVVKRARRRQMFTASVGAIATVVVGVGGFLGVRGLLADREDTPADRPRVEGTVNGITVIYPEGWFLVDPVEAGIEAPPLGDELPHLVFWLSSYDPVPWAACPGLHTDAPREQLLMSIQELPLELGAGPAAAPWPADLAPLDVGNTEGVACYPGYEFLQASWSANGRSFEARAGIGPDAAEADRDALLEAFAGLRFAPSEGGPSKATIASGEAGDATWELVASRSAGRLVLELQWEEGQESGGYATGAFQVPDAADVELATHRFGEGESAGTVIFGVVSRDVARIIVEIPDGPPVEVQPIDIPDAIDSEVEAFVATVMATRGTVVPQDADGFALDHVGFVSRSGALPEPGDLSPLSDVFGTIVGYVVVGDDTDFGWSPPGPGLALPVEAYRDAARAPLVDVNQDVASWWDSRPGQGAPDDAFRDWWSAYPLTS
jgi:hypothetical protein